MKEKDKTACSRLVNEKANRRRTDAANLPDMKYRGETVLLTQKRSK